MRCDAHNAKRSVEQAIRLHPVSADCGVVLFHNTLETQSDDSPNRIMQKRINCRSTMTSESW